MKYYTLLFGLLVLLSTGCGSGEMLSSNPMTDGEQVSDPLSERDRRKFDSYFFEGVKQRSLENYDLALKSFEECALLDPSNAVVQYEIAQVHLVLNRIDQAQVYAERAIQLDPSNKWYKIMLISIYEYQQQYDKQIEIYQSLLKDEPGNIDYLFDMAIAQMQIGDYAEAIKTYDLLEAEIGIREEISEQKKALYLRIGDVKGAANELEKLIEEFPDNALYYVRLAELYQANGMEKEADEVFGRVMKMDIADPMIALAIGDYFKQKGDFETTFGYYEKAMNDPDLDYNRKIQKLLEVYSLVNRADSLYEGALVLAEAAAETHPKTPEVWAMLGDYYRLDNRVEDAQRAFRTCTEVGGNKYEIWIQLLLADSELQQWQQLADDAEKALEFFPSQSGIYYLGGLGYLRIEDYAASIDLLTAGLDYVLGDARLKVDFYSLLGEAYYRDKQYENSDKYYEKALSINANNVLVLNNYAYYLSVRGDNLERAEELSRKCNELDPNNGVYQDTYAWILYKMGDYTNALLWIEKAIQNGGASSGEVLEHYGDILFRLNRVEEAVEQWKKAAEKDDASDLIDKKIRDEQLYE